MTTSRQQNRGRLAPSIPGLKAYARQLTQRLQHEFVQKLHLDPTLVLRHVTQHLRHLLLPRKHGGAAPRPEITLAYDLWRQQQVEQRRGQRTAINWCPIAQVAIPSFSSLPAEERTKALRRLRNAVHNRAFALVHPRRRGRRPRRKAQDKRPKHAELELFQKLGDRGDGVR